MGINEVWAANAPNIHSSHQSISKAIKPEPSSFQIARAVFLPDTKDDLGYSGRYIDNEYFKETFCDDYPLFSCPAHGQCSECRININKKKLDSCFSPYIKSENHCICPPSVSLNYANEKCLRYCDGDCIEKSCTKTPNQTGCTNGTQACNDGCGGNTRQCCIACTDIITTKPSNSYYIYSSCNDGSQTRQIKTGWACDQGYSQSGNSCEKNCVPKDCSSYPLYSPPSSGLYETCTVGCGSGIVRYKSTCTPKDCSAYPLYTAPSNASYETCSVGCNSGITKYRLTTCNAGYYLDGESCIKCTKSYSSCLDGKTLVNTCKNASGTTVGDCVDCRDETSPYNPCYGYYICEGEKIGNGATCLCGNITYYEQCLVKDNCTYEYRKDPTCASGVRNRDGSCESTGKHIPQGSDTCVSNVDGYTYYRNCWLCYSYDSPCYGFKTAYDCSAYGGLDTSSESCSCGGSTFYKSCKNLYECNYEETFASCKAKGKGFVFKCADEAGNRYGECS